MADAAACGSTFLAESAAATIFPARSALRPAGPHASANHHDVILTLVADILRIAPATVPPARNRQPAQTVRLADCFATTQYSLSIVRDTFIVEQ
jgi:hypothetical protein